MSAQVGTTVAPEDARALRYVGALAALSALWSLFFAGNAALQQGWTTDEPVHLQWSERFWHEGETERDSAPRYDSKTPIHVPNALARNLADPDRSDDEASRLGSRLPQLAWLLLLYVGAAGLGSRLGGPLAGRFAVLIASLDPNLTAHASVVTTDIAFASATILALWVAVAYRQEPSAAKASALGVFVGIALIAKFSAVLLVPLALGTAFWPSRASRRRAILGLAVCASCAWLTLGAAYRFDRIGAPLSTSSWKSHLFQRVATEAPRLPALLPMSFLEGVDRSRERDATVAWRIAIAGQVSEKPLWFFFILGWLFKTPVVLILASVLCLPWIFRQARHRPEIAWLLAHQTVNLLFFSLAFRTQLGYRFVLMIVPVTAALVAAALGSRFRGAGAMALAGTLTALSVAETAPFWGDPLAFSSAVVQPKKKAYLFLANSDIDWNQNRERWLSAAKDAGLPDNGVLNPPDLQLGLNVVQTSRMAGVVPGDTLRWARKNLEPRAVAGWTHHFFDVKEEEYDRFLTQERTLQPTPGAEQMCGLSAAGPMDAPGIGLPYQRRDSPVNGRISILCVATRKGADVAAHAETGRYYFAPAVRPDLDVLLVQGQRIQFRLVPGVHAFAIREIPFRRASLPYQLTASFSAMRYGAILKIIQLDAKDVPEDSGLLVWFRPPVSVNLP